MKIISKWILPILLLCNLIIFLEGYIGTGNINFTQLCIVFGLTPIAAQGLKFKFSNSIYFTYFSGLMLVFAGSMLILAFIK